MKGFAVAFCVLVLQASNAVAQTPAADPPGETAPQASAPAAPPTASAPAVDPLKLPVSLGRIRMQLAMQPETKTSGLKIHEVIEVVGVAPKLELWDPETAKLATGPVPWGAPTHKDFIALVTPQEFKNYPMDINALVQWLLEQLNKKKPAE